ncbi:long polar fimbrial protein LpfD [Enterobacter quasihormaechei]|uniref:Long polar fimbrial protein LpfD n=1 Tax=Enterobacter quasihormaechei TaxID=2529382 RepID=A0AAE8QVN0_9ENTR|nr:long polar fimbrial protein LpfD [Enterobacter quasihormaechei]TCB85159.1 long polar fimbrial protein LpfD [Enterobacter quasihormaechei]
MLKKLMTFAGLLGGAALFSGQAIAAADFGPCTPDSTHVYSTNINKTVTDVSKNVKGATFIDFDSWNLGGSYVMSCECPDDPNLIKETLFKTVVPLPFVTTIGDRHYHQINNNIAIASDVLITGGRGEYLNTPFENEGNHSYNRSQCSQNESSKDAVWTSGSKGNISLYILHPFVGENIIPSTKIMELFATKKPGVYGSIPASSVFLSGSIIVPQGCELSGGSTLEIPFGDFKASDFKDRKGQTPQGSSKYTKELQFKCTNISDGVKISLRIEGTPNANDSNAIDMGNPDIGVVIEGKTGNILVPNDASSNQALVVSPLVDDIHRVATTTITAYPISTTGKVPAAGDYEGIATMRIDVE